MQDTAIVIPSFWMGRSTYWTLQQTLMSIERFSPGSLKHTYVVDDYSYGDRCIWGYHELQEKFGFKLQMATESGGLSKTFNIGLKHAKDLGYKYAMMLMGDIELTNDAIGLALPEFINDPKLALIGALRVDCDGKAVECGWELDAFKMPFQDKTKAFQKRYLDAVGHGLCLARLSALDSSGWLSAHYQLGYSDIELGSRLWSCGEKVLYNPHIICQGGESVSKAAALGRSEASALDRWSLDKKNVDGGRISLLVDRANQQRRFFY